MLLADRRSIVSKRCLYVTIIESTKGSNKNNRNQTTSIQGHGREKGRREGRKDGRTEGREGAETTKPADTCLLTVPNTAQGVVTYQALPRLTVTTANYPGETHLVRVKKHLQYRLWLSFRFVFGTSTLPFLYRVTLRSRFCLFFWTR